MNSHLPTLLSGLLLSGCLTTACRADEDAPSIPVPEVSEFRSERPVQLPSVTQPTLFRIPFDSELHRDTREGWPDVQIRDQNSQSVPFIIQEARESDTAKTSLREWAADQFSLRPLDGDALEIRITLRPEDPQPDGLRLITPLIDFEHRIQVFDAGVDPPVPLCDDAMIFDYSQFMDVRRTDVDLRKGTSRQLTIRVDQLTQDQQSALTELTRTFSHATETGRTERSLQLRRAFRIDRILLRAHVPNTNSLVTQLRFEDIVNPQVTVDTEHQQTLIRFDTQRQPVSRITLKTSDNNFSRLVSAQIRTRESPEQWQEIGTSTIRRFSVGKLSEEHLSLDFPPIRHTEWRLVIHNRDSPPVTLQGLTIATPIQEAVFLATPGQSCSLLYGDDKVAAPSHDIEAITRALQAGEVPTLASLGPVKPRRVVTTPPKKPPGQFLNHPVFLGLVVAILVVALGTSLYKAAGKVQSFTDESQ